MDPIAAGFWGAFFGTAMLMLVIALAAFARSGRRVALTAALAALLSVAYVVAFLGGLPLSEAARARVMAHVAPVAASGLAMMLLVLLGWVRQRGARRRAAWLLSAVALAVMAIGWVLPARQAFGLGAGYALALATLMLGVCVRSIARGDRLGWQTAGALSLVILALSGLTWIAARGQAAWPVHAATATASMAYLSLVGWALWTRYSYLLELAEVMAHGPSYDPVTRMRSHSETGQMVGDLFFRREAEARPVGVIAVCIANLYALENLHGRFAFNHALFVVAGRLRRCLPETVEMGRLGEDGFLLLARNPYDVRRLNEIARTLRDRLSRPVVLSTSREPARLEEARTAWAAEVGIGVLATHTQARPSQVVATVRAMARTAWSYASRLAWFDDQAGQIAELPREDAAAPAGAIA